MLSILIPTFNYNVFPLVLELQQQCKNCNIDFEIIVIDDAGLQFQAENQPINKLQNCIFTSNIENIGRSKMRNLLAQKATYDWLLFLDADTIPRDSNFISLYIKHITKDFKIVYGGIEYSAELVDHNKSLRWFYGKKREAIDFKTRSNNPYISFLTLNFLIPKSFFKTISFNEDIPNLRHEDTLFSFNLAQKKIPIIHIDNPIIHLGLDENNEFLEKTKQSVVALKNLVDHNLLDTNYVRLAQVFSIVQRFKLNFVFKFIYKKFSTKIETHLCKKNPNMYVFDLYRLTYYATLK